MTAAMSDRRLSWVCFAATALFYLSFHSYFYNFDGVACAVAVELSDFKHLVHGNHLAYGVAGWLFWSAWKLLGYRGPALLALQAMDSLLDAGAVAVFFSALRRARLPRGVSVACAAGLALSHGFWLWSLEAQVYPLGLLFAALALREMLSDKPRPLRLGVFNGLAILGHVGHLMMAPAALYALKKRTPRFKKAFTRYAAAGGGLVLVGYAAAGLFAVRARSVKDLRVWLLGSAALNHARVFEFHGAYSWTGVFQWARMTLRLFCDMLWAPDAWRPAASALGGAALALAAAGAVRAARSARRYDAELCGVWLAGYAALFLCWEPHTMVYRLSDLLPLWTLAALAVPASPWPVAALAGALGLFNAAFGVGPKTDPAGNAEYQEALWLGATVPSDGWVIVSGEGQVYVPYFAHRRPLNLYYLEGRIDRLPAEIDARRAAGGRVFVTSRTLARQDTQTRRILELYGLSPLVSRGSDLVYELGGSGRKGSGKPARAPLPPPDGASLEDVSRLRESGDEAGERRAAEGLAASADERTLGRLVGLVLADEPLWNEAPAPWKLRLLARWLTLSGRRVPLAAVPVRLVYRARGARPNAVELAGNWSADGTMDDVAGWQPARMTETAPGVWSLAVRLRPSLAANLYHAVAFVQARGRRRAAALAAFSVPSAGRPAVELSASVPAETEPPPRLAAAQRAKVAVLCVDGGSWHVLRPLAELGMMPNLKRLLDRSAYGVLTSGLPGNPTLPNIFSALTGMAPSRSGVSARHFDLDLGGRPAVLWEAASARGASSLVVGIPGAFPEKPVAGRTVSSLFFSSQLADDDAARKLALSPHVADFAESQGHRRLELRAAVVAARWVRSWARLTSPPDLGDLLLEKGLTPRLSAGAGDASAFASAIDQASAAVVKALLEREPADLVCTYWMGLDAACHRPEFWRAFEPESLDARGDARLLDALSWKAADGEDRLRTARDLDRLIGLLAASSRSLVIFSDHGFVPDGHASLQLGALKLWRAFEPSGPEPSARVDGDRWTFAPAGAEPSKLRRFAAFLKGLAYLPSGEALCANVATDEARGEVSFTQRGAASILGVRVDGRAAHVLSLFEAVKTNGGVHAPAGILLIAGPDVRPGPLTEPVYEQDLAPTALYLLGAPAAADMDGRLVAQALKPAALAARPPSEIASYGRPGGRLRQLLRLVRL